MQLIAVEAVRINIVLVVDRRCLEAELELAWIHAGERSLDYHIVLRELLLQG